MSRPCIVASFALTGCATAFAQSAEPTASLEGLTSQQRFLQQNCIECHNSTDQSAAALFAGLFFDKVDVMHIENDPETWEKVVRKLSTGMMPPAAKPRPDTDEQARFLTYLETELGELAARNPNPGRPALHRVNRTEYANAIRDLLALDVDATALLPADDSSFGFDNIAGSLGVSPVLLERYVAAAGKISRLAIGDTGMADRQEKYVLPGDLTQNEHIEGLPFGTRGGALIEHHFPVDAEYVIRADLVERGGRMFGSNNNKAEQLEVTLDGKQIALQSLADYEVETGVQVRMFVTAGPHKIGAAFLKKNHAPVEDVNQPFEFSLFEPAIDPDPDWTFVPHLGSVAITGPFNTVGISETPSRARIFVCRPANQSQEEPCAREIIATLATRAYRHPVGREQISSLMEFYTTGRAAGDFESGIELALRRILASPEFVFRFEHESERTAPGEPYRIDDLELASRLSFFLWSSIPDDELLDLAAQNKLHEQSVLRRQVRRMLADPRSDQLIENFAGQWLYLRNLDVKGGAVEEFPDFDDNLREAFRTETELLFGSIVREDRNVVDLLTADYTFVNERLAEHYDIPGVYGSHFRKVTLENDARRGLLGQGSILDGHLVSEPHVAGAARRLGAREHRRRRSADSAAERPRARGNGESREHAEDLARPNVTAHREAILRGLPQDHGPCRLCARELRRGRQVANGRAWRTDRRNREARRRHRNRRHERASCGAAQILGSVRADGDRKAHDLCVGARARVLRHAGRATHRACEREGRLQVFVHRDRNRRESAISNARARERP